MLLKMADEKCCYIDFDWKSHRETLDDVFFTSEDVIKRLTSIIYRVCGIVDFECIGSLVNSMQSQCQILPY